MFGEPLQRPLRGREELRQVAVSNDKLVQDSEYAVGGRRHILRAVGLANRTISLPSDVPVVHGSNVAVQTDIAVVCQDTASALRTLVSSVDDATKVAALSFANSRRVGGGYKTGALAQEEDLCRVMPRLYSQLKKLIYPLPADSAHFTTTILCRSPEYELVDPLLVNIISASMPNVTDPSEPLHGRAESDEWWLAVTLRIRAVLHTAVTMHMQHLVLGAFGCGAFGNPAREVAQCFYNELRSAAFAGAFRSVVFAILDSEGGEGMNLRTFEDELARCV